MGSGFVSARITHRLTMVLSIACAGIALLVTRPAKACGGPGRAFFDRALHGLYLPSAIAAITGFVSPRHWGKAIAVHEVAPNLAFVLAPLFAEALLAFYSWKTVLAVLGTAALLSGAIFLRFGRVGAFAGEAPNLRSMGALGRQSSYWLMILLFGLGISGSLGIYTMLPLFLVSAHGHERDFANTLLALSRIPGVLAAFGSGWFTDRIGPQRTMLLILVLNGLLTMMLGIAPKAWLPYLVFIQPALAVCFSRPVLRRSAYQPGRGTKYCRIHDHAVRVHDRRRRSPCADRLVQRRAFLRCRVSARRGLIVAGGLMSRLLVIGRQPVGDRFQ